MGERRIGYRVLMANILKMIQLDGRDGAGREMGDGRLIVRMEVSLNDVCLLAFWHFCVEAVVSLTEYISLIYLLSIHNN
jgi:hypothetical protein